jgi:hypothetical protein
MAMAQTTEETHSTTTTTTTNGAPAPEGAYVPSQHQLRKDQHAAHEQSKAYKDERKADASHKVRKAEAQQDRANAAAANADNPMH